MTRAGKDRDVPRWLVLGGSVVVSIALHVGTYLAAPDERPAPPPRPKKVAVRPVPVTVRQDLIRELERPKPEPAPETKPPEPKTPEPKKPEPKPEPKKSEPKKAPEPPKPQPKPVAEPVKPPAETPKPAEPSKPKPFVLKNVALKGGVAVQTGEDSNLFGDPTVDAKGFKKGVDAPMQPGDTAGTGTGGQTGGPEKEKIVIKQPRALNDVKGEYPSAFRDLRRVVRVELMLTVGSDGTVKGVKVRKGAEKEFNDAAIRAVNLLKFEPATRNGTPIAFNLKWTVVFIPEGT